MGAFPHSTPSLTLPWLQPVTYVELVRLLEDAHAQGEKGHRQLLGVVLPRLLQFEVVPPTLVPQLLQFASHIDDRCSPKEAFLLLLHCKSPETDLHGCLAPLHLEDWEVHSHSAREDRRHQECLLLHLTMASCL